MHFINLSGYLAASVQIKPVNQLIREQSELNWMIFKKINVKFLLILSKNSVYVTISLT